ncbi:MAG: aminoacyl-tRNA hydrolase [bacterium]|nr:aminoacyl-tRNA hydrolase [bacterium]
MRLIVGLGNPGDQYQDTPHNAGFAALDHLAERLGETGWKSGHQGVYVKGSLNGCPFVLLKPQTYMNLSGRSVVACAQFFKVTAENILVVADDLDLELGRLRFRTKGGHGGHNGLRNLIELLGTPEFPRLRIGIGRPAHAAKVTGHVLGKLSGDSAIALANAAEAAGDYIFDFIEGRPIMVQPAV